ncbi:MAG: Fic family protein [archaeon]
MAYIYKKTIHGKSYYYLRVSKRVKGKCIKKDIAYLGSDKANIAEKLDKLGATHKAEIRKTYRNIKKYLETEHYLQKVGKIKQNPYLSSKLLNEIEAIKLHFNEKFKKLHKNTQKEIYKSFLIDFAFNTTSLEGNTITLAEAQRLLTEYLTPKGRTLREVYDLQNTEKTFFEILKTKGTINNEMITQIHDNLMDNIDNRKGYRTHDIRVMGSRFKSSPAEYIKADMKIMFNTHHESKLHPFVLAGIIHHKLEGIHPFADGNGRTGRMLLNYMLLKTGYPPMIIRKSTRTEYLHALNSADKAGLNDTSPKAYKKLTEYLAEEMIHSYWNNFLV